MSTGKLIAIIGGSILFMYAIIQILGFYGIGPDVYGTYVGFYSFLLLSIIILPNSIITLKADTSQSLLDKGKQMLQQITNTVTPAAINAPAAINTPAITNN